MDAKRALGLWAALVVGAIAGCGSDTDVAPDALGTDPRVTIAPQRAELRPGEQRRFSVSVTDAQGQPRPASLVHWSSSDPAVVAVDAQGLATARALGTATITAATAEGSANGTALVCNPCPGRSPEPSESPGGAPPPEPPPDPRRPPEIVDVSPAEDAVLDPTPADCSVPPCPARPDLGAITARSRFPGDDALAAGRMWIDGTEVPVSVRTDEVPTSPYFADGHVYYRLSGDAPGPGLHEATVEVTSREGRVVSYTWHFTFLD